ncbi:Asparagine synthetase domain-containing protein 1 [Psilocybe cubensis]|uniref:Asparagine synthetase domain-containing protein 1 n=1 Tax=Psilocybe cubensis TaxID=181762 RepID=A0ACB8HGE5_PSICU|nr:Asparagine synthetase domain-containing protein 1 [Psilocybe cubensis]KAH9486732.1 Asparagine synthetase domain-containing protein 1 [Psilocybe cubensis]
MYEEEMYFAGTERFSKGWRLACIYHANGQIDLTIRFTLRYQKNKTMVSSSLMFFALLSKQQIYVIFLAGLRESSERLYFGRDPLGRRSLLLHAPTQDMPYLLLSSVSGGANPAYDFLELPTEYIYSFDLKSWEPSLDIHASFHQNLVANSRVPALSDVVLKSFAVPAKINITLPSGDIPQVKNLANIPQHLKHAVDDLIYQLDRSVMLQVSNIPYHSERNKARVAVLFSGGIDSTILTFLANKYIPLEEPIDLLNVAFENPRKIRVQQQGNIGGVSKRHKKRTHSKERNMEHNEKRVISYLVPDRVTGMQEVEELRRLCPGRTWNFVEINVPFEECQAARPLVESLMHPSRTVMDLSLALALFFASRGVGQIRKNFESDPVPYTSEAKVLINGLGSDELLGGYGRHRSVYSSGGWEAVINELQEEIDRIPTRNLGRDDRVISCHGKETRHPFLSLSLVSFLASLPVHFKMDPRLEPGIGDKMLLRLAARKIGLTEASSRKKRAMQFGSHSARMDGERRGDMGLDEAIS